jgi:GAF domain-containing protein/HAMP domain-containing protein
MTALNAMMGQTDAAPTSVEFTGRQGSRAFGQVLWLSSLQTGIVYEIDETRVFGALSSLVPFTVGIFLVALLAMGFVLSFGAARVFRPLVTLAEITRRFSDGDFSQRAEVRTQDEIGLLARSFNHMAEELSGLYRSLEQKVQERTREIRTAAAVAEKITSTTTLGDLLGRTVQLLIEQFHFYQASIFMLDRGGRYAVLRAAAGPASHELLARGYRLEVGAGSIIGWVSANNQPRIAADVAEDPVHLRDELLPATRSEAGIPITAAGHVLGVLDVQSAEPGAFGAETVVMLQTLGNQIAVAIQNMSLIESSQTDLREVERLHGASRNIAASRSREEALATAARILSEATYPAILVGVNEDHLEFAGAGEPGKPEVAVMRRAIQSLESKLGALQGLIKDGALVVEPTSANVPMPLVEYTRQVGYRSVAFLPIASKERLAGLIVLGSPTKALSQVLIEPYASMADLVGTTLTKILEADEREHELSEREALNSIGREITRAAGDLGGFFTELHAQVRKNIGDYSFVVAIYDATTQSVTMPYAYAGGRVDKVDAVPLGEGLTSTVIRTRQPLLLAEDVERQALSLGATITGRPAQTWMGAPMLVQDRPIGALVVEDPVREHAFGDKQLAFLVELANQVAAVLHNAQLLDESRAHAFQLETAAEIARDISGSLNLDELLAKAVNYLRDRLGFHHAAVFLIDDRGENATIREATGEAGAQMKRSGHRLGVGSRSVVGFVAGRGERLIVNDTAKDSTYYANPLLPSTRSEAALPLKVGERIVGVMDVQSAQAFAFQDDNVRTLQILADQLAVAVVNSELFAETQEHLSQHRLLHHITTSAASGSTLEEALQSAVTGLQVTLGGDRVAILMASPDGRSLEVQAAAGYSDDVMRLRIPLGSGITGWSASHRRSLRVDDVAQDPRYIEASANTRSELAVPLIYHNEALGVLNVESEQTGAYNDNDEEMLATLGGSLAAIIANARLLEQLRAQADRERALFEITNKIRRAPDMQSILVTTASELTRVVGARRTEIRVSTQERNAPSEKDE